MSQSIQIPDLDIWAFLFERGTRPFSDEQGKNKNIKSKLIWLTFAKTVLYTNPRTGQSYTYYDVSTIAQQFGYGLRSRWSWQKGDVLTFFSPNSIDIPVVIWGCQWAGGIVSPANPSYTAAELTHHLKDSGSKALLTQKSYLRIALQAAKAAGLDSSRIMLIGDDCDPTGAFNHFKSILAPPKLGEKRSVIVPRDDLAFLVYSSGTTGLPKGVMLSHSNVVSNLAMVHAREGPMLKPNEDKILSVLPYYHIYGTSKFSLVVIVNQSSG